MDTPIYAECVALLGDPADALEYLRKRCNVFRAHDMMRKMYARLYDVLGLGGERMERAIREAVHDGLAGWPGGC